MSAQCLCSGEGVPLKWDFRYGGMRVCRVDRNWGLESRYIIVIKIILCIRCRAGVRVERVACPPVFVLFRQKSPVSVLL